LPDAAPVYTGGATPTVDDADPATTGTPAPVGTGTLVIVGATACGVFPGTVTTEVIVDEEYSTLVEVIVQGTY
jgi:hypothetical protein